MKTKQNLINVLKRKNIIDNKLYFIEKDLSYLNKNLESIKNKDSNIFIHIMKRYYIMVKISYLKSYASYLGEKKEEYDKYFDSLKSYFHNGYY